MKKLKIRWETASVFLHLLTCCCSVCPWDTCAFSYFIPIKYMYRFYRFYTRPRPRPRPSDSGLWKSIQNLHFFLNDESLYKECDNHKACQQRKWKWLSMVTQLCHFLHNQQFPIMIYTWTIKNIFHKKYIHTYVFFHLYTVCVYIYIMKKTCMHV